MANRDKTGKLIWQAQVDVCSKMINPQSVTASWLPAEDRREYPYIYIGCSHTTRYREEDALDAVEKINDAISASWEMVHGMAQYDFEVSLLERFEEYGLWVACLDPMEAMERMRSSRIGRTPSPRKAKCGQKTNRRSPILNQVAQREDRRNRHEDIDPLHRSEITKCYQADLNAEMAEELELLAIYRDTPDYATPDECNLGNGCVENAMKSLIFCGLWGGLTESQQAAYRGDPTDIDFDPQKLAEYNRNEQAKQDAKNAEKTPVKNLAVLPDNLAHFLCKWSQENHHVTLQCLHNHTVSASPATKAKGLTLLMMPGDLSATEYRKVTSKAASLVREAKNDRIEGVMSMRDIQVATRRKAANRATNEISSNHATVQKATQKNAPVIKPGNANNAVKKPAVKKPAVKKPAVKKAAKPTAKPAKVVKPVYVDIEFMGFDATDDSLEATMKRFSRTEQSKYKKLAKLIAKLVKSEREWEDMQPADDSKDWNEWLAALIKTSDTRLAADQEFEQLQFDLSEKYEIAMCSCQKQFIYTPKLKEALPTAMVLAVEEALKKVK